MNHRSIAGFALAVILGTAAAGCCGPASPPSDTGSGSVDAGFSTEDTSDIPPTATPGASGLDPEGLDRELDAMERELDSMEMPSDADFTDAEGAVY